MSRCHSVLHWEMLLQLGNAGDAAEVGVGSSIARQEGH